MADRCPHCGAALSAQVPASCPACQKALETGITTTPSASASGAFAGGAPPEAPRPPSVATPPANPLATVLRVAVILLIGAGLCAAAVYVPPHFAKEEHKRDTSEALNVGGSSVVFFIMDKWKLNYVERNGLDIVYSSSGSAGGVKKTIDNTYQIGFSSAPLTEEERKQARAKGGDMVQIPVVLIAVAPIYNVQELNDKPPLKFTGEVLADIFLGKIKKWNDPALKKLNEDVKLPMEKDKDGKPAKQRTLAEVLPDKDIRVVHRKDPSGTTFLFSEYLAGASESWKKAMGPASTEVKWPTGEAVLRNYGLAGYVKRNDATIGYVEMRYASTNKIRMAAMQNADKSAFLEAEPEFVTAAAKNLSAEVLDSGNFSLTNRPGKDAYPICGVEWAVCYKNQPAAEQKKVADFLDWAVHDGQAFTKELHYAPLPEDLVHYGEKKIKLIR